MIVTLPLSGDAAGPTVTDVGLEVQSSGIVVVATATDPDGTENLLGVMQSVALFRNETCEGTPITLEDDLAGSDLEETFGTAVDATGARICTRRSPVRRIGRSRSSSGTSMIT